MMPADPPPGGPDELEIPLLTVTEVGRALRVSSMTVYRMIQRGELPALRIGGTYRVPSAAFREFLEHRRTS